ncbi:MAG: hypothetical protein A2V88_04805 [Elusimicrobia bacterium RBG_16_66_12]|nr:MAG: hypothetical protein A2V88_04805 [Elusimicrobia bacterium RBG_16_66_12]
MRYMMIPKLPHIDFRGLTEGYWFCLDCIQLAIEKKIGWLQIPHSRRGASRCPNHHESQVIFFKRMLLSTPVHSFVCGKCGLTSAADVEVSGKIARYCYMCAAADLLVIKASVRVTRMYRARYRSARAQFRRDFDRLARSLPRGHDWGEEERLRERFSSLVDQRAPKRGKVFDFIDSQIAHGGPCRRLLAGYIRSSFYSLREPQYRRMTSALDAAVDGSEQNLKWRRRLLDFSKALLHSAIRWGCVPLVLPTLLKVIRKTKLYIKRERARPSPDSYVLKLTVRAVADLERELRHEQGVSHGRPNRH